MEKPLNVEQLKQIQKRVELLDLLLEAGADGYLDWNLDEGTVEYSARFRMILGYEDEIGLVTPWAWLSLTHPEDRPKVAAAIEELTSGEWPFDFTFRMRHHVAGWRWLRGRAATRRSASGHVTRVVITFSDVSAQVRAERRQTSLINAVPDLLIRVQNDFTVVDIRVPEGEAAYARDAPRAGDTLSSSPFCNGWFDAATKAMAMAIEERRATRFEAQRRIEAEPAGPRDIEVRVFPSSDEETLLIIRDITDEKHQREQGLQSQKLEAIGQLAAGIAHEINTPLQFVGDNLHFLAEANDAFSQVLARYRTETPAALAPALVALESDLDIDYMTAHAKPAFVAAIDGVRRVSEIVQAMKSFSHPGPKEKRPEDLNRALETTIIISTNVWKYVADIEREFSVDLPRVDCVVGEINQVFLNLITNAAHAVGDIVGESGAKGRISISTRCNGDAVEIRVGDSGGGIPKAIRARIFEPFFTTKSVGKGTGQGLPLARAIIQHHQGRLDFETIEGTGTTFVIWLPISGANTAARPSTSP